MPDQAKKNYCYARNLYTDPTTCSPTTHISLVEGLTRSIVDGYLLDTQISRQSKRELCTCILHMLTASEARIVISRKEVGGAWDYLINGPGRFLVRGKGTDPHCFTEGAERISFFLKPGFAPVVENNLPGLVFPLEGSVEQSGGIDPYRIQRNQHYTYTLGQERMVIIASARDHVDLRTPISLVRANANAFWSFVFGAAAEQTGVSLAHAAQLLGLSILAINRRAGDKLPVTRQESSHNGVTRAALEEYLCYRALFPQGCGTPSQVKRYELWRTKWRQQYQERANKTPETSNNTCTQEE